MDYQPLAEILRPETFDDVIGQDELVGKDGIIRKMVENDRLVSFIMYGNPGIGKTTIAKIIESYYPLTSFFFSATSDNKQTLKDIINRAKNYTSIVLFIDEIHRMNKDIQDYLLPWMENGKIIVVGMTTVNPYISVNPAIRSRCNIFRLNDLNSKVIKEYLTKAIKHLKNNLEFDDEVLDFISETCGNELRVALNDLELIDSISNDSEHITIEIAKKCITSCNLHSDKNGDTYYNLLSALQKSIRGSDVHAAIYYLARLINTGDLEIILRRLSVIAYEDIGLANPSMGEKVLAVGEIARQIGLPEARIPLANVVIEMALSPKSNSAYKAIDMALEEIKNHGDDEVPAHLINIETYTKRDSYIYPHDYKNALVYQQYLPDRIKDMKFYKPNVNSKFESALFNYYEYLESFFAKAKENNKK